MGGPVLQRKGRRRLLLTLLFSLGLVGSFWMITGQDTCVATPVTAETCALSPAPEFSGVAEVADGGAECKGRTGASADFVGEEGAGEHRARVASLLWDSRGGYEWIRRRNKAAKHPTDFGLMSIAEGGAGRAVKAALLAQPWVRAINLDRQLARSLTWEQGEGEREGEAGAHYDDIGASEVALRQNGACALGHDSACLQKPPGRMQTRPTIGLHGRGDADPGAEDFEAASNSSSVHRRLLYPMPVLNSQRQVTKMFEADKLWSAGYHGSGIRMGVFDTGIKSDHPAVKNIKERSNWTHEPTLADGLGHGSFVAGVIASVDPDCLGFAPEVELHTFRVFTNDQVSYTSWFLDAFNYAIATDMQIVNLSIGGPDYLDEAFVDKVLEITSNGLIMVSAIGNDGPHYGTLNNPADQNDVIGVGGIDYNKNIAHFSSRGMSTWELPGGYGRAKPDVTAYGKDVGGSKIQGGCRTLSGTSVASPVVAGAVCLLASVIPTESRARLLNPASMKQALVEGAERGVGQHMYEQGQGRMSVINSMAILKTYRPRASAVPAKVDLTDCPFMWPFCKQSLYAHALPVMINMTVLNGMSVTGEFEAPPVFHADAGAGQHLHIEFAHSLQLWPWSGYLVLYMSVLPSGQAVRGQATGRVEFTIRSPPYLGETAVQTSKVTVPIKVNIIPTPPREQRILWDQFHSIRYPPGYIPRDNLDVHADILDWHGDHPHTNFKDMYNFLTDSGYFIEVSGRPFTCFDAQHYGTLMLVDSEEEYYAEEVAKLRADVEQAGMGLLVFGEWYNRGMLEKMRFYDDNTRSWWSPYTGGANVPALNDLLAPFGIALGDQVLTGTVSLAGAAFKYLSGAQLARFPAGGYVHHAPMSDRASSAATVGALSLAARSSRMGGGGMTHDQPILGLVTHGKGRIAVMGDANCLDSTHQVNHCHKLLQMLLEFTGGARENTQLFTAATRLHEPLGGAIDRLPERRRDTDLKDISTVLNFPLTCDEDMDAKAWELRSRFMHRTEESALLAERGVGDYGTRPAPATPAPPAVRSVDVAAARQATAAKEQPAARLEQDAVMAEVARMESELQQAMRAQQAGAGAADGVHGPAPVQEPAAKPAGPRFESSRAREHSLGSSGLIGRPLIMGKVNGARAATAASADMNKGDGMVGARDLPNIGSLHFSHALALVGIMVVLLLWRMSRRQRGGSTPTHRSSNPGNSRAYRRIFGR